jgi:hypothetical protein
MTAMRTSSARSHRLLLGFGALFSVSAMVGAPAKAAEALLEFSRVRVRVLAPDWAWKGDQMNVLVIAERLGPPGSIDGPAGTRAGTEETAPIRIELRLELPEGIFEGASTLRELVLDVAPGAAARGAFRELVPKVRPSSGVKQLSLEGTVSGEVRGGTIDVEIVRGALAPSDRSSVLLAALCSLALIPLVLWFLHRYSGPGWWRRFPPPLPEASAATRGIVR